MEKKKTLTILLCRGPYASEYADIGVGIAKKAMEKGYDVRMFLYMDGVWVQHARQSPKVFPNVGKELEEAIKLGADVRACERCSSARGINEEDIIEGGKITSLYDFVQMLKESDRVLPILG
ncbi:MAG: hypothetical protein PWR13_222 [Archaeoglobi archaeon]|nr:DsrE family protein [Candidatus Mnemosynella bozhongmuii]MDI3501975.1 hypothetical protein [Archaeoglobi archaeon]MDK2781194.1 hypothetical protein [Archaeoglobi archaeon]